MTLKIAPILKLRGRQVMAFSLVYFVLHILILCSASHPASAQDQSRRIAELVQQLKTGDSAVRIKAVQALGGMGKEAKEAIPDLIVALKDPDVNVRYQAAGALSVMGKEAKGAVPDLIEALKDKNPSVPSIIAVALGHIGKETKDVEPFIATLKDKDPDKRFWAAMVLGHIAKDAKAAVPDLIEALKDDPEPIIRRTAAKALGAMGKEAMEAVPDLILTLKDQEVSSTVAETLGQIGKESEQVVMDLITALKEQPAKVRFHVAGALAVTGKEAKGAVPALRDALNDEDSFVPAAAAKSLGAMGAESKEAVPDLISTLKHWNPVVRLAAVEALGKIGKEAADVVAILTAKLDDKEVLVRRGVAEALGRIGKEAKEAIPALLAALKLQDENYNIRAVAATALGNMGEEARETIPALTAALKDWNHEVPPAAAAALGLLSTALFDSRSTETLPQLKIAYDVMKEDANDEIRKNAVPVKRTIDYFESQWWVQLKKHTYQLIGAHYIIAVIIFVYVLFQCFWAICFWKYPVFMLRVIMTLDKLGSYKIDKFEKAISIKFLIIFPWFHYHSRLLDAWVKKYLDSAEKSFTAKLTVRQHKVYVPTPALLNGQLCDSLIAAQLQSTFEKPKVTVLLTGEGGAGKTSLACQMGYWAMEARPEQRLCKAHPMISVLIEGNLKTREDKKNSFFIALRKYLSDLTGDTEPILDELVIQLLKKNRVLVIVDSLSEVDEATQNSIRQAQDDFLVGALIVTTRNKDEVLGGAEKTIINLPRLKGKVLTSFLQNYLCQRLERELSEHEDLELFAGCKRLSELVGEREITVLIAKMYAEQMLAAKLKLEDEDQPRNLPELMKSYVRTLSDKVKVNPLDAYKVLSIAKLIAWECLRQKLHPSFAQKREVLAALKEETNAERLVDYLEESVPLVQTKGVGADQLKFFLDPLAEYLAAFYLVEHFPDNKLWSDFLERAYNNIPGASRSFIVAVQDCCTEMRDDYAVPERITRDLAGLLAGKQEASVQEC
jgi:HEAT repeat protein